MPQSHQKQFIQYLEKSLNNNSFVQLILGKYRGRDLTLKKIIIRLVEVKKEDRLSFVYRYQTKDITKNYSLTKGLKLIEELLGTEFLSANLFTLDQDVQIEYTKKSKSKLKFNQPAITQAPAKSHDRKKDRHIEPKNNVYLEALGVTNESGEIRERQGDKFRQINKFIEVVESIFRSSQLISRKELTAVDMGCGKGYLTFALYDYFNNSLDIKTKVIGVEVRDDLVKLDNQVAQQAGFHNLQFIKQHIKDYVLEHTDILVALHACDTATDDAIYRGISANASIIICAPCCHKQIRPQITSPQELKNILKHGIFLERQTEMVTDAIRALYLELNGYTTKVFEFISLEHTNKNVMIVGIKHHKKINQKLINSNIKNLKEFFGIKRHYLESLFKN